MFTNVLSQQSVRKTNPLQLESNVGDPESFILERMSEFETEYFDIVKEMTVSFHHAKLEGNYEIALEGMNDFKKSVREWFQKVFKYIDTFFAKSKRVFQMQGKPTEELIETHKKEIKEFEGTITVEGFEYSNIGMNIDSGFFLSVASSYNKLIDPRKTTAEEVKAFISEYVNYEYYDYVRGAIIGENQPLTHEEFPKVFLEKLQGSSLPIEMEVGKEYVEKSSISKLMYQDLVEAKKKSEAIIKEVYKNLSLVLEKGPKHFVDNNETKINVPLYGNDQSLSYTFDEENFNSLEEVCKAITTLSKQLVTITLEAYRVQMSAVKDARVQNDRILRAIVAHIRKGGNR